MFVNINVTSLGLHILVFNIQFDDFERCEQIKILLISDCLRDIPHQNGFTKWNVSADRIQFVAPHKKSFKANKKQSFITKNFTQFWETAPQLINSSPGNINYSIIIQISNILWGEISYLI